MCGPAASTSSSCWRLPSPLLEPAMSSSRPPTSSMLSCRQAATPLSCLRLAMPSCCSHTALQHFMTLHPQCMCGQDTQEYQHALSPASASPTTAAHGGCSSSSSSNGSRGASSQIVAHPYAVLQRILDLDYTLPPRVSHPAQSLLQRILVTDPRARPSIPDILQDPWFREGLPPEYGDLNAQLLSRPPAQSAQVSCCRACWLAENQACRARAVKLGC